MKDIIDITESLCEFCKTDDNLPYEFYHFASADIVPEILKADKIYFRMTHIDDFDDALEGRVLEAYYDLVLERLLLDGVINHDIRSKLAEIPIAEQNFFSIENTTTGRMVASDSRKYDAFVACFSYEPNDKYMFNHYIKSEDKKGYRLAFRTIDNRYKLLNEQRVETYKVLYGIEVVSLLYEKIRTLLKNQDEICIIGALMPAIKSVLQDLRCRTKLGKYQIEREVRVVYKQPKDSVTDIEVKRDQTGRRYILYPFDKDLFLDYKGSGSITKSDELFITKLLRDNKYFP